MRLRSILTGSAARGAAWLLAASGLLTVMSARAEPTAPTVLIELRAASGGSGWDDVAAVISDGEKASAGLTGRFHAVEDLRSGHFIRRADYGIVANAEGLDGAGRWRQDNSGQVHPLDSDEAKTVAVTEAYLARRGYLVDHGEDSAASALPPQIEAGQTFDRVAVSPKGGRTVVLWIDRFNHRLDRTVIQLSTRVETVRYHDYRIVDGLALPFEVETTNGDQADAGVARLAAFRIIRTSPQQVLDRPSDKVTDALIQGGAASANAPLTLDAASGFPIVLARINGKGPFPFILDTGGHDILTPAAANSLRLSTVGQGFSLGAGAGSTPTKLTKVDLLSLGGAELHASPFVVLQLDLGQAPGADGEPTPIAGIIGLELFERFKVTLDYAGHTVLLQPFDIPTHPEQADVVARVRFTEDMPIIEASIDGQPGWFAVDTGNNTDLIVSEAWAKASGLEARLHLQGAMAATSVGGSLDLRKGAAETFSIGAARIQALPILLAGGNMGSLSSRSEAGNIGNTVLSRYKVTFDYRHELLSLEKSSK